MTKAITQEDCQIVRDLHDEGLSDSMNALRFDTSADHVKSVVEEWF